MCSLVTFVGVSNWGSDAEPEIVVAAECEDGPKTSCGFRQRHTLLDTLADGTVIEHQEPGDWWITSEEMAAFQQAHEEHSLLFSKTAS